MKPPTLSTRTESDGLFDRLNQKDRDNLVTRRGKVARFVAGVAFLTTLGLAAGITLANGVHNADNPGISYLQKDPQVPIVVDQGDTIDGLIAKVDPNISPDQKFAVERDLEDQVAKYNPANPTNLPTGQLVEVPKLP